MLILELFGVGGAVPLKHGRHLGGDRGTRPPHVFKGGGHNIKCPPHVF